MEGLHIVLQTKNATHRAVWKRQLYDLCRISGSSLIRRQNKSKVNHYRDWFICQYSFSFYLLQAIGEDKMNAVEILLKNGEDAMSKSPTTWPKAKIMVHDNEGGRLIISESYKITILFQCHPLY